MDLDTWKLETKKIFWGVVAIAALSTIFSLVKFGYTISSLSYILYRGLGAGPIAPWYTLVFPLLIGYGYLFYFWGVNGLYKGLVGDDKKNMKWVWIAVMIAAGSMIITIIPVVGKYFSGLGTIAAMVFYLMGYKGLKQSTTLPQNAVAGFKLLFISTILNIVSAGLGIIPFADLAAPWVDIAAFVLLILGWLKVMKVEG